MAATRIRPPDSPDPASLPERLAAFLAARQLAAGPRHVGLSGGCDSVCLLHLLRHASVPGAVAAVHVHHGLSPNADAWATFCTDICRQWSVPLTVLRVTVADVAGQGLEAAARQARYAALAQHLPPGAPLFLAQHRGDQAETLLFNLARGSGVHGLAAMRVSRRRAGLHLLRPLLDVSRQTLENYAQAHALPWIEDESNADTRFSRNFLRQEIMPALRRRFPAVEANLAQTAAHCAEAAALLDELAADDWQRAAQGEAAQIRELRLLSPARLKNLLRWRLRALGWQVPTASRLEEFCRQLLSAGPDRHPELRLPDGCMRVGRGQLRWLPQGATEAQ